MSAIDKRGQRGVENSFTSGNWKEIDSGSLFRSDSDLIKALDFGIRSWQNRDSRLEHCGP